MNTTLHSSIVTTQVVSRNISGLAWIDVDKNGRRDESETILSGVKVALFTKSGDAYTKVTANVTGNPLLETQTDANGIYTFTPLKNDTYYVDFALDPDIYSITDRQKAGVGAQ